MKDQIKSHAKLILFGEYSVLYGGRSIVLPLKYWQESSWKPNVDSHQIKVTSYRENDHNPFFEWASTLEDLSITAKSSHSAGSFFTSLFANIHKIDQAKLRAGEIINHFNFDLKFGFGSSSTSIKNIAMLFKIDPWILYFSTVNGSGADLAATYYDPGVLIEYVKEPKKIKEISPQWKKIFEHSLFVYLGNKVSSELEINKIKKTPSRSLIQSIDGVIDELCGESSTEDFIFLMKKHERLISEINGQKRVQEKLFSDFPGAIKSLGAWGGDYIWALSSNSTQQTKKYFQNKKFNQFYTYQELVL